MYLLTCTVIGAVHSVPYLLVAYCWDVHMMSANTVYAHRAEQLHQSQPEQGLVSQTQNKHLTGYQLPTL